MSDARAALDVLQAALSQYLGTAAELKPGERELTSWKRSSDVIVLGSAKDAPCRLGAWGFGGCLAAASSSAFATCAPKGMSHESPNKPAGFRRCCAKRSDSHGVEGPSLITACCRILNAL